MGLDLYSGPLWRLFSGKLERPSERLSREVGLKVQVVYAPGAAPLSSSDAERAVHGLRRAIDDEAKLRLGVDARVASWSEDCPTYFSEQLRQEGLQSILLMAAYNHRADLTRPSRFEGSLDGDPAYGEAFQRGYYMGPIAVFEAQMFVPSPDDFLLIVDEPGRGRLVVTSTSNLAAMLRQLGRDVWGGAVEVEGWSARGLVPKGGHVMQQLGAGPQFERVEIEPVADEVRHNAEYAYAIFAKALAFAEANNVPIRHDG